MEISGKRKKDTHFCDPINIFFKIVFGRIFFPLKSVVKPLIKEFIYIYIVYLMRMHFLCENEND